MFNLVPYPVSMKPGVGTCPRPATGVIGPCGTADESVAIGHKLTALQIATRIDRGLPPFCLRLGAPRQAAPAAPAKSEGYALASDTGGAWIVGHDRDGLFWGLVTLEQLLDHGRSLPAVRIRDYPAFPFRMHHDDISRKQVSTVEDFKRIIRHLSRFKVRYYTPYMEDMLHLPSHPDIGRGRGKLMPAEVKAILREARLHNVTIFPTYSLIGHQENLLRNPTYRKYAREVFQPPSAYDVAKPILRPYLKQVVRDVCAAFPDAPYFHACFDEVIGLTEKEFLDHANWCADEIAKYGKTMLMWNDMLENHWGVEKVRRLRKNIVPVMWRYDDPREKARVYDRARTVPLGLAGYNNCCAHLPDFATGKANLDAWARLMRRWRGPGYGASMWGDEGYENARDLCWNLFAYNGETAWRGAPAAPDFEARFQSVFYGRRLPGLRRLVERDASRRAIGPCPAWELFRAPMPALVRLARAEPKRIRDARRDLAGLRRSLAAVGRDRLRARREASHLDHFMVALRREINLRERMLLADRVARGLDGSALRRAVVRAVADLHEVRGLYERAWRRHNKRPNLEVSLAVYDRIEVSLRDLVAPSAKPGPGFRSLDVTWNAFATPLAGSPRAARRVNGVPFAFADGRYSHAVINEGATIRLPFASAAVKDIHLLCAGKNLPSRVDAARPLLEVRLLCAGAPVFVETLLSIRHLCDWWAPRGEHMWAGGGLAYADPRRVRYAYAPGLYFGVMHVAGFRPRGVRADALELRLLGPGQEGVALFGASIEVATGGR